MANPEATIMTVDGARGTKCLALFQRRKAPGFAIVFSELREWSALPLRIGVSQQRSYISAAVEYAPDYVAAEGATPSISPSIQKDARPAAHATPAKSLGPALNVVHPKASSAQPTSMRFRCYFKEGRPVHGIIFPKEICMRE
jgi:hypothetical protein